MATRTVLVTRRVTYVRESTDGELQGVILELAEVQASGQRTLWVIIIMAVLFAAAGVLYRCRVPVLGSPSHPLSVFLAGLLLSSTFISVIRRQSNGGFPA